MALQKGKISYLVFPSAKVILFASIVSHHLSHHHSFIFSEEVLTHQEWVICWWPISRLHCFLGYTYTAEYPMFCNGKTWSKHTMAFFHLHAHVSFSLETRIQVQRRSKGKGKKSSVCSGLTPILTQDMDRLWHRTWEVVCTQQTGGAHPKGGSKFRSHTPNFDSSVRWDYSWPWHFCLSPLWQGGEGGWLFCWWWFWWDFVLKKKTKHKTTLNSRIRSSNISSIYKSKKTKLWKQWSILEIMLQKSQPWSQKLTSDITGSLTAAIHTVSSVTS